MRCEAVRKKLSAYLDQELSSELARQINTHIQSCPACRKEAADLRQLWQTMGEWEVPERILSENIEARILRNITKKTTTETWLGKILQNINPKPLIQVPAAVLLVLGLLLGNYMGAIMYKKQLVQPAGDSATTLAGVEDFLNEYEKIYGNIF